MRKYIYGLVVVLSLTTAAVIYSNAQITKTKTQAQFRPCVWPNTCAEPVVQFQPCVWPNHCGTSVVPVTTCQWPNTCAAL